MILGGDPSFEIWLEKGGRDVRWSLSRRVRGSSSGTEGGIDTDDESRCGVARLETLDRLRVDCRACPLAGLSGVGKNTGGPAWTVEKGDVSKGRVHG